MNTALVTQLKDQNFELQQAFLKDKNKMSKLQAHDKVLQQYMLEEEARENIFDWIRDFKDYEIRNGLQGQIDQLHKEVAQRDQKIMSLQLQIEELMMHVDVDHEGDQRPSYQGFNEESYQTGASGASSNAHHLAILE